MIERALILEDDDMITMKYLPRTVAGAQIAFRGRSDGATPQDLLRLPTGGVALGGVEMSLVRQAIEQSGGNQTKAAELLGISRDQFRYRMKKLDEAKAAGKDSS